MVGAAEISTGPAEYSTKFGAIILDFEAKIRYKKTQHDTKFASNSIFSIRFVQNKFANTKTHQYQICVRQQ